MSDVNVVSCVPSAGIRGRRYQDRLQHGGAPQSGSRRRRVRDDVGQSRRRSACRMRQSRLDQESREWAWWRNYPSMHRDQGMNPVLIASNASLPTGLPLPRMSLRQFWRSFAQWQAGRRGTGSRSKARRAHRTSRRAVSPSSARVAPPETGGPVSPVSRLPAHHMCSPPGRHGRFPAQRLVVIRPRRHRRCCRGQCSVADPAAEGSRERRSRQLTGSTATCPASRPATREPKRIVGGESSDQESRPAAFTVRAPTWNSPRPVSRAAIDRSGCSPPLAAAGACPAEVEVSIRPSAMSSATVEYRGSTRRRPSHEPPLRSTPRRCRRWRRRRDRREVMHSGAVRAGQAGRHGEGSPETRDPTRHRRNARHQGRLANQDLIRGT